MGLKVLAVALVLLSTSCMTAEEDELYTIVNPDRDACLEWMLNSTLMYTLVPDSPCHVEVILHGSSM